MNLLVHLVLWAWAIEGYIDKLVADAAAAHSFRSEAKDVWSSMLGLTDQHESRDESRDGPHDDKTRDERHYSAASSSGESDAAGLRKSNAHLALAIDLGTTDLDPFKHPDELKESGESTPVQEPEPQISSAVPPPRISFPSSDAGSEYSDYRKTNASIPAVNISGADDDGRLTGWFLLVRGNLDVDADVGPGVAVPGHREVVPDQGQHLPVLGQHVHHDHGRAAGPRPGGQGPDQR